MNRPDLHPRNLSQNSPFASPPHLPPTQLHPSFGDVYDPTISPNHPLSPSTSASVFPSGGVVAVHPVTGRPLLPTLPTLPARLRLSEEDEDDEDAEEDQDDDEEGQHHDPFAAAHKSSTARYHGNGDGHGAPFATDPQDDEADLARYERERFDSVVNDLMNRYRSRRHRQDHSSHSSSQSHSLRGKGTHKPTTAATAATANARVRAAATALNAPEEYTLESLEATEENTELMSHLMAKLRQEVVTLQDEGWMFGEASVDRGGEGEGDGEGAGGYGGGGGGGGGAGNAQGMAGGGVVGGRQGEGGAEVVAYE